jgi:8-oxo-dGTP pyrophosphatase MutT (NUDIX family)
MQWHPHKTVATLVEREGHFLMVEEIVDGRTVYNQPAGHLEAGETLAEAAVRETLEETGWDVDLQALLGIYQTTSPTTGICYIRTCFIATPVLHLPERPLDTGITRALWMSHADITAHREQLRSPVVLTVISDYLARQRYPLSLIKTIE